MEYKLRQRSRAAGRQNGLTLVELIVTVAILAILASASVPLLRFQVKREKERELRGDLRRMRGAIDAYRDAAEKHAFQTKLDQMSYPPDLETLVKRSTLTGRQTTNSWTSGKTRHLQKWDWQFCFASEDL